MENQSFCKEMVLTVLNHAYTRRYIQDKTSISTSSIRRILMGEDVDLSIGCFRRLLYLYCYVKVQQQSGVLESQ